RVLQHRHVREQVHVLERAGDPELRYLMRAQSDDAVAEERDLSRVGRIEAGDDVEQRALARSVRPDHAEDLARIDMHVEPSERRESAELLADPLDLQERLGHPLPSPIGEMPAATS